MSVANNVFHMEATMRHLRFVPWILFGVLACTSASAQDTLRRVAERQQIAIGYSENSAPFSFVQQGTPAGYAVELCMGVASRLKQALGLPDLQVRFESVDQDSVQRILRSGAVDLMCAGVSETPARRTVMAFSAPIFFSDVKLMVRKDDGPRTLADLKGGIVAVIGRTTAEAAVSQLSARRGLAVTISQVVSPDAALSMLRLHQADAWARDETLLLGTVAREPDGQGFTVLGDVLSTEAIAIAMPRDQELQRRVDQALADLKRSGQLEALYDKWFVQPNAVSPAGWHLPLSPDLRAAFDRLR